MITSALTNYCCSTSARQAYERSYKVVFGSDVTAAADSELQEFELKVMRKGFANVSTPDEIIAALS